MKRYTFPALKGHVPNNSLLFEILTADNRLPADGKMLSFCTTNGRLARYIMGQQMTLAAPGPEGTLYLEAICEERPNSPTASNPVRYTFDFRFYAKTA